MEQRTPIRLPKLLSTLLIGLGLLLLFIAERILSEGTPETVFFYTSIFVSLAGVGRRVQTWLDAKQPVQKKTELMLLYAAAGIAFSLLLYGLSTDAGIDLLGLKGETAQRVDGVLTALWPATMLIALSALLFMEAAYARMPIAEGIELRRIYAAASVGLSLALAVVFLVSVNYVASQNEIKRDLSYFRTSDPSAGTLSMIERLSGEPVRILLFYPKVNDVLQQLTPYFERIDAASKNVQVEIKDHALAPELVQRHRIRSNGFVLLLQGQGEQAKAESFEVGTELQDARSTLRKLDEHFQQSLTKLTKPPRSLHLTVGHREFSNAGQDSDTPGERTQALNSLLQRFNIRTNELGVAQGLASEVPAGTRAVAAIGPREEFLPEEAQALLRYVQNGGRVLITVDPRATTGLEPFFQGLGIRLQEGVLNSNVQHMRRTFTPADREIIFTNSYSTHPTVTTASGHAREVATVFLRGGAFERIEDKTASAPKTNVIFPLRSSANTWLDKDDDHEKDEDETASPKNMMAAVTVPNKGGEEGRAVIIADGDFVTDQMIRVPGNMLILVDSLRWLIGEEEIAASLTSEEDIPIEHTNEENKIWFYATAFGVPLPLIGIGIWAARRRRRRSEAKS